MLGDTVPGAMPVHERGGLFQSARIVTAQGAGGEEAQITQFPLRIPVSACGLQGVVGLPGHLQQEAGLLTQVDVPV